MPSDGDAVPGGFEVGRLASAHVPLVVGSVGWLLFGGRGTARSGHIIILGHVTTLLPPGRFGTQARPGRQARLVGWLDGWMAVVLPPSVGVLPWRALAASRQASSSRGDCKLWKKE